MVVSENGNGRDLSATGASRLVTDSSAFLISLLTHSAVLVALGLVPVMQSDTQETLAITAPFMEAQEELTLPEEFYFSDLPADEIGANSIGDSGMAFSTALAVADVSELPTPTEVGPAAIEQIDLSTSVSMPKGLHFDNLAVRGVAGEGTTGAAGAVDRLTQEIMLSLEERKTLVIWLFDQSPSMLPTRKEILQRFDRIYDELGLIEASGNKVFKKHSDKPLLTAVVSFGKEVKLLTEQPTDSLTEIKEIVNSIPEDNDHIERTFKAIYATADKFKSYRTEPSPRNVLIVAFTDEVGDDQHEGLEKTVKLCRRYQMPVYIVGTPAPFGQEETWLKWADPNPNYDQSESWGIVNQGPETLLSERVKLSFLTGEERSPMDSGFGPYSLTRLCYETGGIYFTVHPNRNERRQVSRAETATYSAHLKYFFDPVVMRKYRPDYVPIEEYHRRVMKNKSRAALIEAARRSGVERLTSPKLEFVKRSEAGLAGEMSDAQKEAARLEPLINSLYEVLKLGESDREKESSPRWQVGYDLAMGQVMAVKVRTETYNAMLAAAKRGLKFKEEKNNTWVLTPADEVSVGSQLQKMAERAKMYLERVASDNPGTPWALLAEQELKDPFSWKWTERYTELAPPPRPSPAANNNTPPPARRDEKKVMLPKPVPPKRDFKRL